jgi:hypothetical protein
MSELESISVLSISLAESSISLVALLASEVVAVFSEPLHSAELESSSTAVDSASPLDSSAWLACVLALEVEVSSVEPSLPLSLALGST